jgi:hypothetical protein
MPIYEAIASDSEKTSPPTVVAMASILQHENREIETMINFGQVKLLI